MDSIPTLSIITTIAGVSCHRFYFIRGEHHLRAPYIFLASILVLLLLVITTFALRRFDETGSISHLPLLLFIHFISSLFGSILVYRTLQHPLRGFHGPRLAAISKLWHFSYMFSTNNHLFLDSLYKKYGTIVRTGPQELTIVHCDTLDAINGPGTSCIKSPWYDILWPYVALNSIRNRDEYRSHRKTWDSALTIASSDSYDEGSRVHHYATILLRKIENMSRNGPINITALLSCFTFDVMGEIAFGQSFGLLSETNTGARYNYAPKLISEGMEMLKYFTPVPWLGNIVVVIAPYCPIITQNWSRLLRWAAEVCDNCLERGKLVTREASELEANPDHMLGHFIKTARQVEDNQSLDRLRLYGDSFALTIAGSDTAVFALTMLLFELAQRPGLQQELRNEITAHGVMIHRERESGLVEAMHAQNLSKLSLMTGCINEVMRLYPAVPSGGIRQTVDKGVMIAGRWIPPNTIIVAPRWSIGRLESAFERPQEFIPERWTTRPELVKNSKAFNAFGIGRHTCPGKQFGLLEVRMVTSMILSNFSFDLYDSKTSSNFICTIQDSFSAKAGDLDLIFKPLHVSSAESQT